MIAIYQLKHSPFCIPIVAIFKALDVPLLEIEVSNADRRQVIELTGGKYYQVPVLADGKRVVYESAPDSQDVARYVDKKFAHGRLFPKKLDGLQSIVIAYLENEVEAITFKLIDSFYLDSITDLVERTSIIRHKERKFGRGCIDQWRKDAPQLRVEAENVLTPFDRALQASPFIFGDAPVYADYLLLGIIGNLTYRNYNPISPRLKALKAWAKRIGAHRIV